VFSRKKPEPPPQAISQSDALFAVINMTQAMIQFLPDGTILSANENFLSTMGYRADEIVGRHHSIFVLPEDLGTPAYRAFWADLAGGKSFTNQYVRVSKSGARVWIQATYAPVFGPDGKVLSVIKVATDISPRQRGILALAQGLERLQDGDLACRVTPSGAPDIDLLIAAFNKSTDRIASVIAAVVEAVSAVEGTARGLRRAADDLSSRTTAQAATLEQANSAISALNVTATASSGHARDVEHSANQVIKFAEGGGKVADDAITAMSRIAQSAQKIAMITNVIDDLAFQTNLLALNARVEAARAGDSGRGFAVVASEVRELAVRSATAAAEIKEFVDQSQSHVSDGRTLVTRAGNELKQIVTGIGGIYNHIRDIAHAAREQSAALSEVTVGIGQIDQTTQQNAAMVDQSKAAVLSLLEQAGTLAEQVGVFRLKPEGNAVANAPVIRYAAE